MAEMPPRGRLSKFICALSTSRSRRTRHPDACTYPSTPSALVIRDGETAANRFGYASQAVDDLIDALPPMDDEESAREPVREIQQLVASDVPHVPLFFPDVVDVASSRLVLRRLDGLFNNRFSDLHRWDVTVPDPAR